MLIGRGKESSYGPIAINSRLNCTPTWPSRGKDAATFDGRSQAWTTGRTDPT